MSSSLVRVLQLWCFSLEKEERPSEESGHFMRHVTAWGRREGHLTVTSHSLWWFFFPCSCTWDSWKGYPLSLPCHPWALSPAGKTSSGSAEASESCILGYVVPGNPWSATKTMCCSYCEGSWSSADVSQWIHWNDLLSDSWKQSWIFNFSSLIFNILSKSLHT